MIPLVLVHGFMGGSAQWDLQLAEWSPKCPVIAFDLPGFGNNAGLPALSAIGDFADWVIKELRAMGIERYHLLGHSMGGMIVQEMALRDKDRIEKLVLYSTGAVGVLPGRFESIAQSKARALSDGPSQTARRIAATWFLDRDNAANYAACAAIAQLSTPESIAAGLDAMQAWSGTSNLSQIRQKTLVIWGDKDRTYPWSQTEMLWGGIQQANLAVLPECAHAVHLENVAVFNSIVFDFVYGQEPTSRIADNTVTG